MTTHANRPSPVVVNGHEINTLLFDTMGTIVDVDGSIKERLTQVLARYDHIDIDAIAAQWDRHIRTAMDDVNRKREKWQPHRTLRLNALEKLIDTKKIPPLTELERKELVSVIDTLKPWPDSPDALAELGVRTKIVAFSNADFAELAALSKNGGLRWHAVISAELANAYKPHPTMYQTAVDLLHLDRARSMVVAAHPWDLRAASEAGMLTAYIARPFTEAPEPEDNFTVTAADLSAFCNELAFGSS